MDLSTMDLSVLPTVSKTIIAYANRIPELPGYEHYERARFGLEYALEMYLPGLLPSVRTFVWENQHPLSKGFPLMNVLDVAMLCIGYVGLIAIFYVLTKLLRIKLQLRLFSLVHNLILTCLSLFMMVEVLHQGTRSHARGRRVKHAHAWRTAQPLSSSGSRPSLATVSPVPTLAQGCDLWRLPCAPVHSPECGPFFFPSWRASSGCFTPPRSSSSSTRYATARPDVGALADLTASQFIMIFKNNYHQVSFLHVYHHLSIFPIWWIVTTMAPGGDSASSRHRGVLGRSSCVRSL